MKIGILTFHSAHNYGAVLQAYALQEKLKSLGHNVEFIEYCPNYLIDPYKIIPKNIFSSKSVFRIIKDILFLTLTLRKRIIRSKNFIHFIKNNLNHSQGGINTVTKIHDIYIVGSDQIWNPKITKGFDLTYWGNFKTGENIKKITYAASMGICDLSKEEVTFIKSSLINFYGISVREKNLVELLQPLTDKPIKLVLDPTLILDKQLWRKFAVKPKIKNKYVLVYQIRWNKNIYLIAKQIAKQLNATIVEVTSSIENRNYTQNTYRACNTSRVRWIYYGCRMYCFKFIPWHNIFDII